MASINLTKLKPGKTYVVKVRAVDEEGNYSQYSFGYSFTVPATNVDGTQLTAINNSVVTALAPSSSTTTGGALIAGGLDANGAAAAGALNLGSVWNNTSSAIAKLTGTANTGAVVINSTGILGYKLTSASSGQANFFLDTLAGNAYFRGTVYAASGEIGGFHIADNQLSNTTIVANPYTYYAYNSISLGSGNSSTYPNLTISSPSSTLTISGDYSNPYISFNNATSSDYSDMILRFGSIAAPDFGPTSIDDSRGEILFWNKYSSNPNQITIRRFAEAGTYGPDGIAFIDLQTDTLNAYHPYNPYKAAIKIQVAQSATTSTDNDPSPNDSENVSVELYKSFGDTSSVSYPAYLKMNVKESGYLNSYNMYRNHTTLQVISPDSTNSVYMTASSTSLYNGVTIYDYQSPVNDYSLSVGGTAASGIVSIYSQPGQTTPLLRLSNGTFTTGNQLEFYYGSTRKSYFDASGKFIGISSSAGYLQVSGLSASTITIGSTAIGLGNTSASLAGLSSISASTIALSSSITATSASVTGKITAASFVGDGAGLTGITASATGSVTIGSTVIGLGGTSASLGGLTNVAIYSNDTTTFFNAYNTVSNTTGGGISLSTNANATGGINTATGGAISISTNGSNSGANTSATGGAIDITTSVTGAGTFGSTGGNISIRTTGGGVNSPGSITLSSGNGFTISSTAAGSINNFNIGATTPGTGNFTSLTISGSAVATQTYANSASLNAYNSASAFTAASAYNNTSASAGYSASVGSTVIGGVLNSSSNTFRLLSTPATINAFGGSSSITIGYQANGTSTMNIGNQGNTGIRTLNLFTTLGGSGGQNTINIGASGTTTVIIPQVINIGTATGAYNTITIGGATDTALTLNATASVTGRITAASFVGDGAGLTSITGANVSGTVASATNSSSANYASSAGYLPVSGLSASTITIGSTAIGLGNTSASLSGLSSVSASSASISGTINAASVIATQVTGGGMDLVYSGSFASTSGSVLIDNIFSSNYANYRVTYTTASNAAATSIYFRYANAGVPSSSALYTYTMLSNSTSTTTTSTTNSSSVIYHFIGAYATGATHVFEFYGPALTTTHMFKTEIYDAYVGGPTQQTVRGSYTNSSSFSGIVLATVSTSTNFNGTVRVYGYHN